MKKEEWKPVVGYEGIYEVSNLGRVKSLPRTCKTRGGGRKPVPERILKPCVIKGYENVVLCDEVGKHKHKLVHRLVAEAFLPMSEDRGIVEHLDCNSLNNEVGNLRWSTQRENCNNPVSKKRNSLAKEGEKNPMYGKRGAEVHNARKVACFTKSGEFVKVYPSVADAVRETEISQGDISACARGDKFFDKRDGRYYEKKSAGGFVWRYI